MGDLTQEEKDKIRDAGVAKWWEDWFEADYSWEGLKEFPWQGWKVVQNKTAYNKYIRVHGLPKGCPNKACQVVPADYDGLPEGTKTRDATLQDYWRGQEGKLEGQDGDKQYTIAHLPAKYPDDTESWKAEPKHKNWKALSALIKARLESGSKTDVKYFYNLETVTGTDARANFRGCVLPALPRQTGQTKSGSKNTAAGIEHADAERTLHLTLQQAAILHPQNFARTIFGSPTNFQNAQFSGGDADFREAQFSGGYANFKKAQFSGGNTSFSEAKFSRGNANFSEAQFSGGNANFWGAQFSGGDAYFWGAQFSGGDANFRGAQFSGGDAYFNGTYFEVSFTYNSARFEKRALFQDSIFPPPAGSKNAFSTTEFLGLVDFSRKATSDKFFPYNAFGNATIKDDIILPDHGPEKAQEGFDLALKSLTEACTEKDEEETGTHFVALEQGSIRLKRAMENQSDKHRAQRYFKFELLARQKRPSTPLLVKIFTSLYGLVADYGGSIARPLWSLAAVWVFFGLIYGLNAWCIDVKPETIWGYFWGPLEFSMTHVFRPLFIWSSAIPSADVSWAGKYREQLADGGWFAIKFLATLQSFLSLTFLFLFGLATKRKFQIG